MGRDNKKNKKAPTAPVKRHIVLRVAPGRSVTSLKGILDAGTKVDASQFSEGAATIDYLRELDPPAVVGVEEVVETSATDVEE